MPPCLPARALLVALVVGAFTGCGKASATSAPLPQPTSDTQVGVPDSYVPGEPAAGGDGTPSLRQVDWPTMSRTTAGVASDPVNVVVSATEPQLGAVFSSRGWLLADKTTAFTTAKMVAAALADRPYPTAPMSDLLLYQRTQDLALQKQGPSARARDHLRAWQMPQHDHGGKPFWAIACTHDVGLKWAPGMALPTHEISPDLDAERGLVVSELLASRTVVYRYQLQSLASNFKSLNGSGDEIYSDGKVEVLELGAAPAK